MNGGETGIRTLEGFDPLPVFKTGAFNRSAISPVLSGYTKAFIKCFALKPRILLKSELFFQRNC
jgi:hypothetical protein